MIKRKIYVVGGDNGYANWMEGQIVRNMEDANLVVFTGGEDVFPGLYGNKVHPTTSYNRKRDEEEIKEFEWARELNKPMIGICRGNQFLTVMAGGSLIQDSRHPFRHLIETNDGQRLQVTSSHHQQAYIKPIIEDAKLLAWAISDNGEPRLSPFAWGESYDTDLLGEPEVEMVYFKNINALGIQSHPEWCFPCKEEWQENYIKYCRNLLDTYLN